MMKALLKKQKEGVSFILPQRLQKNVVQEVISNYEPLGSAYPKQQGRTVSDRVKLAMQFEQKINQRQGRPSLNGSCGRTPKSAQSELSL
jgi:hypothetical protein